MDTSFGGVGKEVAEEFVSEDVTFMVVDRSESVVTRYRSEGYLAVTGSGPDDEVLESARSKRARGLVAAVVSDADNVFTTLSARRMNGEGVYAEHLARCYSLNLLGF